MKKLFLLLILLPTLAWAGDYGSSIDGELASVTFVHTSALDSAWAVFGYDGDAGDADTANMYDSLKLLPTFSGDNKVLWGDGLDLDSLGTHVVKIWGFASDAIATIHIGIWEHNDTKTAAACGSGTGIRTVTIKVKNAADSVAISGFEIAIYDSSSGEPQANGTTNSNGVYTCSLDDETYTVHITNPPWSLTSPRRFVITANMDSTFYATRFAPGSPPADSLCVVWGRVKDKHGNPYVGAKVSIWMDAYPVTFAGILIDVVTKSMVYTDTLGIYEFSDGIYYSSSLNPSNLKWKVRIKTANWLWEDRVLVPSQASWEIEIPDL